ncbi:MAG: hypothetical protein JXP73_02815 [Deltaproteobacteria bacterium]|nr:hypothetical protein [Deltaproteobacteria bacterium]
MALLGGLFATGTVRGEETSALEPAPASPAGAAPAESASTAPTGAAQVPLPPPVAAQDSLPPPANPALDLSAPAQEQPKPSLLGRWWFWTAAGVVAGATVAVIVLSSRGHAPPATDLGNQEFRP